MLLRASVLRPVRLSQPKLPLRLSPIPLRLSRRAYSHEARETIEAQNKGQNLAYSRQDLMQWWHKASRSVSPIDVRVEKKDSLDASCTILRPDGTVERLEEPLLKEDVIQRFGIQPRDLRSLDAHILDVRPSLLVCRKCIILCTPIMRAIISADELIMIGVDPKNPLVNRDAEEQMVEATREVIDYLGILNSAYGKANGSKSNFEFKALEALLILTIRGFKTITTSLQERVYSLVPQLRFGVSPAELRNLLESKRTVEDCLYSGRALQSAISAVLGEDEDLAGMYLTDIKNGIVREVGDHQNAELLLEYYERRLDETNESSQRLSSLLADIDSNITLVLASTRVRLQNLELQTAVTTLAVGTGTALAGFFGMNLTSGLENHPSAFYWATGAGFGIMTVIMIIGWVRLIRARRSQVFLGSIVRESQSKKASMIAHQEEASRGRQGKGPLSGGNWKKVEDAEKDKETWKKVEEVEKEEEKQSSEKKGRGEKKDGSEI